MTIEASFLRSAAAASDLPRDGLAEVALVGRSNVGKSSLINALVARKIARTSAAPGKTRLLNVYRVEKGGQPSFYFVDLPGYGYARGGQEAAREFEALTGAYFGRMRQGISALLLVDARHPGLAHDRKAWAWLGEVVAGRAIVATKIDKLARGQRIRATRELESVFETSVLPVSAVTGEGLDELWKLIDKLANNPNPNNPLLPRPRATAPLQRTKAPRRK